MRAGASQSIEADSTFHIRLQRVEATHWEVTTLVDLRTMTAARNFTIDRAVNLPGPNITAGPLLDAKVLCLDDRTGAQFNYTIFFNERYR